MDTVRRDHWERIWGDRGPDQMSWHQEDPATSVRLTVATGVPRDAAIVDIGGGASRFVDRLLEHGFTDLTVLDVSPTALAYARTRLAARAGGVVWVEADVTTHDLGRPMAVWHDRAVFHFLTEPVDRAAYAARLAATVVGGGHVIVAAFSPDGPDHCSGLPVVRYAGDALAEALGPGFEPVGFTTEVHRTPGGATQHFLYGHFLRIP